MVGHFTVHIHHTFNAASAVLSARTLAFLLLPVNSSHAGGKERKVGQGQMARSAGEASFRSLRLFVCFPMGLASLLWVKENLSQK